MSRFERQMRRKGRSAQTAPAPLPEMSWPLLRARMKHLHKQQQHNQDVDKPGSSSTSPQGVSYTRY